MHEEDGTGRLRSVNDIAGIRKETNSNATDDSILQHTRTGQLPLKPSLDGSETEDNRPLDVLARCLRIHQRDSEGEEDDDALSVVAVRLRSDRSRKRRKSPAATAQGHGNKESH